MASRVERTDEQVVRDVLAGDRDAYRLLVRTYGDVMHGHALRMTGSADEAADLVQRALVQGFKKLRSCRDPARVGAWLFRILANLCKDHVRSRRRTDISLTSVAAHLRGDTNPETDAALREALEAGVVVMIATGRSEPSTIPIMSWFAKTRGFGMPVVWIFPSVPTVSR